MMWLRFRTKCKWWGRGIYLIGKLGDECKQKSYRERQAVAESSEEASEQANC